MGKLKILDVKGLISIQDAGRFGYREYGIPQSGAMDVEAMHLANHLVQNPINYPVMEIGLGSLVLECLESQEIGIVANAVVSLNEKLLGKKRVSLKKGDQLKISFSKSQVYNYLGLKGLIKAKKDFGSYSTYASAGFGGLTGAWLKPGDLLEVKSEKPVSTTRPTNSSIQSIRILRGPEWAFLKDLLTIRTFEVSSDSNRMGIRLIGDPVHCEIGEITSSAVVPGTIQLLPSGQLIVLMNDCQTLGGYPRIGTVVKEDLGRLAQHMPGVKLSFKLSE